MVYKLTSCKRVIAKVLTDLDIQEENVRTTDILEWIGEALLKIGGFPQFIVRTTGREDLPVLILSNYQAELPFDFHSLIQISFSSYETGPFYPMRQATGVLEYNPVVADAVNTGVEDIASTSSIVTLAMQLYSLTYEAALELINTEPATRAILSSLLQPGDSTVTSDSVTSDYVYVIRGGYIKTNQETGYLMVTYQAIPTDLEGYPLVPDSESYMEALYWYVVMKLYYPKWVTGSVRDVVYYDAKRSWNYYCKQAYGTAMMPDRGQMESAKNAWNRLIPNIGEFDTNMSFLGEQQLVYNHSTE